MSENQNNGTKSNRGGRRAGAGRKREENSRNNRASFMLSDVAMNNLRRLADESGTTRNDIINRLLEHPVLP